MDDPFEILASKVLAQEASAEEQARLAAMLAGDPRLQEEFMGLKAAWVALHEAGPIAQALDAPFAAISEARLQKLQEAARKSFAAAPGHDVSSAGPEVRPAPP